MKKTYLLIFLTTLILSCSSDDNDSDSFDLSQIEGVWEFNDNTYYLSNGTVTEDGTIISCGSQSIISISSDNMIDTIELNTSDCVPVSINFPFIEWEYLGDGNFNFFRMNSSDGSIGQVRLKVSFPTSNTMKWNIQASGIVNFENYDAFDYNLTRQ